MSQTIYGFKLLDPTGSTYYKGQAFSYNLPQRGEKWSDWTEHPQPATPDGDPCGPGRFHLMRYLDSRYAPDNWWPWWAQGRGFIGGNEEKVGVIAVRVRRIYPRVLWRALRPPFNWGKGRSLLGANLQGADLRKADLEKADLEEANLVEADLRGADLCRANLYKANLREADLVGADLRGANLYGANLYRAYLGEANLYRAYLEGACLEEANLYKANLQEADLGNHKVDDLRERGAIL